MDSATTSLYKFSFVAKTLIVKQFVVLNNKKTMQQFDTARCDCSTRLMFVRESMQTHVNGVINNIYKAVSEFIETLLLCSVPIQYVYHLTEL